MTTPTPYDPIPPAVRAAWAALHAACKAEGFRFTGMLHADPGYVTEGELREVGDDEYKHMARYWPRMITTDDEPCIAARVSP